MSGQWQSEAVPNLGETHGAFLLVLTARWMEDFKGLIQGHGAKLNGP